VHGTGLLALGGPDYDLGGRAGRGAAPTRGASDRWSSTDSPPVLTTPCPEMESLRWDPLPGSLREADEIAALWKRAGSAGSAPEPLLSLTGAEALESRFKADAPGHRVLHLATHGFFVPSECVFAPRRAVRDTASRGLSSATLEAARRRSVAPEPLTLSGLALAGANRRAQAPEGEEDGVLTAPEIATLDLFGTEWAVLSACETGTGLASSGEGVFGLRRAFQIAGARTVIMSLWSVQDEATRAWMKALYEARLERRLATPECLRAASLEVLKARRAQGESTHPFYWGAFVAIGDWR
jgi:CHAT domain-containing protein